MEENKNNQRDTEPFDEINQVLEYRGLKLDPFQSEAIMQLEMGNSVLISAPTGVGKTLVADYLIEKVFKEKHRVIYTAPIKALSNQKFKEFKKILGEDNVGIITGDVVINSTAPVLIMTTEIFRNILHLNKEELLDVSHVIFDEIHFLADEDRGAVWEESIIFMPNSMRLLGLSATIPNAEELAFWIEDIKGHKVSVIKNFKRAVPLKHSMYEKSLGECNLRQLKEYKTKKDIEIQEILNNNPWANINQFNYLTTTHVDMIEFIYKEKKFPCLYFVFSRRQCEEKAGELSRNFNFLTSAQRDEVIRFFDDKIEGLNLEEMPSVKQMRKVIQKGICYHHAGLLPVLKEIVEDLFEKRLISVLYATETFAVGINYPVRTVCFDSMRKFNGVDFRPMSSQEYFQMAGRAGRRGLDREGYVYTLVDMNFFRPDEFPSTDDKHLEPLVSRFSLSYNTVLNLVATRSDEEILQVLKKNFASYQTTTERKSLSDHILSCRRLGEEIAQTSCEIMGKKGCPIYANELKERLSSLKLSLKKASKRRHNKEKKEYLKIEIEKTRRLMCEANTRQCLKEQKKECRKIFQRKKAVIENIEEFYKKLRNLGSDEKYVHEFNRKKALLARLNYLDGKTLLPRGEIARNIHAQELLVTELIFSGILDLLDANQLAALTVCIGYEPRRGEFVAKAVPFDLSSIQTVISELALIEETYMGINTIQFFTSIAPLAYKWSSGIEFADMLKGSSYAEGDVVSSFRRCIDLLRQIRSACKEDKNLTDKITDAIDRMDRGVVQVLL